MSKIKKVILLPDIHYPEHSKKCLTLVNKFIKDFNPDTIIYQGDQLDLGSISAWDKDKPLLKESKRLWKEYTDFDNDVLKVHETITKRACERVFIIGNHEYRAQRYIEKNPELEGMIEPEIYLELKDRGYTVVDYNKVYKLGKLNVIHGFYYNTHHAAHTVGAFEGNVVYCHTHTSQEFTKTTPLDASDFHTATCLPCLCNLNPEYQKNKPSSWINGFGVAYLSPDGSYSLYRIIIVNGQFVFNDKLYK